MDKIISGFRSFGFTVIWIGRGSRSEDLPGNMASRAVVWQLFGKIDYRTRKCQQPLFQIVLPLRSPAFVQRTSRRL